MADVPRVISLKTDPEPFSELLSGRKTFEWRKDDRGFRVGDVLCLREHEDDYTGRSVVARVTYLLKERYGVPEGYCVMALETVKPILRDAESAAERDPLALEALSALCDCEGPTHVRDCPIISDPDMVERVIDRLSAAQARGERLGTKKEQARCAALCRAEANSFAEGVPEAARSACVDCAEAIEEERE